MKEIVPMPRRLRDEVTALVSLERVDIADKIPEAIAVAWRRGYRSLPGLRDCAIHILSFGDGEDS